MSTDNSTRLTFIRKSLTPGKSLFQCSCGVIKEIDTYSVKKGITKSCRCYHREQCTVANKRNAKHNMSNTIEFHAWTGFKRRCLNPKHHAYKDYGGRGITVCVSLQKRFLLMIELIGMRPPDHPTQGKYTVDRKNNELGYWCGKQDCSDCGPANRPMNLQWATVTDQSNHRRSSRLIEHDGQTLTLSQWARLKGMSVALLRYRLKRMPVGDAFNTPIEPRKKRKAKHLE